MKKLLIILAVCGLATVSKAQSITPIENQNPIPYSSPQLLTSIDAYNILVYDLGVDPVTAAWVVTHSDTAYAGYYTLDQLLAKLEEKLKNN